MVSSGKRALQIDLLKSKRGIYICILIEET
jgi:hypothetical protein